MNRAGGWTLLELMITLFVFSILAVVALPSYQGYKLRGQIAAELPLAETLKLAAAEYHAETGQWPTRNADVGYDKKLHSERPLLEGISLGDSPTAGAVTITFDAAALPPLAGGNNTLTFYPEPSPGGFVWRCDAGTLPERYRPPHCRAP